METSWLSDAWDTVKGGFGDWIDYDNMKFERQMAEDRWRWEQSQAKDDAPASSTWGPVASSNGGIDSKTLLIGAAVLGGGYLVARQLKLI